MSDENWKLEGAAEAHGGKWCAVAVDNATRNVKIDGEANEVDVTIVLMSHETTGEMKSWETRGKFTLDQARAMPVPAEA